MVYKLFDEKSSGAAVTRTDKPAIESEVKPNKHLAEEL